MQIVLYPGALIEGFEKHKDSRLVPKKVNKNKNLKHPCLLILSDFTVPLL